jgi:hypothetical protein
LKASGANITHFQKAAQEINTGETFYLQETEPKYFSEKQQQSATNELSQSKLFLLA